MPLSLSTFDLLSPFVRAHDQQNEDGEECKKFPRRQQTAKVANPKQYGKTCSKGNDEKQREKASDAAADPPDGAEQTFERTF